MQKAKLFYVEDDSTLAFLTQDYLEQYYQVTHFDDGDQAIQNFDNTYDICVLDISLPKKDGFEIAQNIRQRNANIPIIFLSARSLKEDRIKGFHLGADDYLVKPFSLEELKLKMDVFLKRSQKTGSETVDVYHFGNFIFKANEFVLLQDNIPTSLTEREAALLKLFLNHKNTILKREKILQDLWGNDDYFSGRSLDVFISRLRKLFKNETHVRIENLPRIGFKMVIDDK